MVSNFVQECHRPGLLKQQNKSHKHGRHRSKGAISNALKGKVSVKTFTKKARHELKREERRNQAQQLRLKKRNETLMKKRSLGGSACAPFLVAVVSLNENIDPIGAVELIKQADSEAVVTHSAEGNVHLSVPRFKQRFTFVTPAVGDLYACLDLLKVASTVLFLVASSLEEAITPAGEQVLLAIMAQGLPSTVVAITDLHSLPPKKRQECKQQVQKQVAQWLPEEKVMTLDKEGDGLNLLRHVGLQKQRPVAHRDARPHMLAETLEFIPDQTTESTGTLKVTGFLRGRPLSVNGLVHIPSWGDFQMTQIDCPSDPHCADLKARPVVSCMDTDAIRLLQKVDPTKQESLVSENDLDPMEGEQTWPTAEELRLSEEAARKVKRVPKGTSEYQAAWIPDYVSVDADDESDEDDQMNVDEAVSDEDSDAGAAQDNEDDYDTLTVTESVADVQRYDEKMNLSEEQEALKKLKEANMDSMFPDEVDTPMDDPARVRFQKYRGLQSFRTSPWDPKENLPRDYARIFQFENFEHTRKKILKASQDADDAIMPGWYVTVHVCGVPQHLWDSRPASRPLVLVGLLPHEQKMSVLNVILKRPTHSPYQLPIKSKEQLIFHVGYRRFRACPIFSQHTNGSKHKYERFFQPDATVVASLFAPVVFPQCPVLVFIEKKDGSQDLVATGRVLSANPDRIVVKRVVLSGHPFRVHKRSAVVRFMFFNAEDVIWFKPVELRTKYGRRGHIRESLGTHGHMKCVFDGQLKSQDTVLMNLYKRVFPKWTYEPFVNSPRPLCTADSME